MSKAEQHIDGILKLMVAGFRKWDKAKLRKLAMKWSKDHSKGSRIKSGHPVNSVDMLQNKE